IFDARTAPHRFRAQMISVDGESLVFESVPADADDEPAAVGEGRAQERIWRRHGRRSAGVGAEQAYGDHYQSSFHFERLGLEEILEPVLESLADFVETG